MEVKNLLDPAVKKELVDRINNLRPSSQRVWGTMDVAQMLAHVQRPLGVAIGTHQLKGNIIMRMLSPFIRKQLYNDTPYRRNLPTDKTFKIADHREFERERQQLLTMIDSFSEDTITKKPHPYFGHFTVEQWSKMNWKHIDHHLHQFGV